MPVKMCRVLGVPGFKWGDDGTCYTFNEQSYESREKAYGKAYADGRKEKEQQKKLEQKPNE